MWLVKVFSVICFTTVCAAQDVATAPPTTPLPTTTESTTVYVPPVPSLERLSAWSDVFPSEKVKLSCSVTDSSDWTFTWYRDEQKLPDPDPNVSLSAEGSDITITAATPTYSGSYSCKGLHKTKGVTTAASSSVKLTVDANKPKPTLTRSSNFDTMYPGESVTFTCKVDVSSGWDYLWYQGNQIKASSGNTYTVASLGHPDSGQYHCQAKRGTDPFYTDTSDTTTLQVSDPPKPSLKLLSPWSDVFENETVEFGCEFDNDEWISTWYRNQEQLKEDMTLDAVDLFLNITMDTQTLQGGYACKAYHESRKVSSGFSNTVHVTVDASKPKPTLTRSSNFDKMYPEESVTFTCKVNVSSGWDYLWYQGNKMKASSGNTYTVASLNHSDSGQYHCQAKRGKDPFYTDESDATTLQVSDPPKPSLKLLSPWSDVFEGETVEFDCKFDSDEWIFTWYRNQEQLKEDQTEDAVDSFLNITMDTQTLQGGYACKAYHKSRKFSSGISNTVDVTVYENTPKPTVSKVPGFKPMYVGETVNFNCKVDVSSGWEYQWYKDGIELSTTSESNSIRLALSDRGKYSCKATRGDIVSTDFSEEIPQDVLEIPVPSLELITPWLDVFPTESVKLRCGLGNSSDWTYTWYKQLQEVQADNVVSFDSNRATLSISSAAVVHGGQYNCMGHLSDRSVRSNSSSGFTPEVYDKKPRVLLTQDPEYEVMFSGESVAFSCHINVSSGWEYLWYKDGNPFTASANRYPISSVGISNTGSYTCKAKRDSLDQAFLTDSSQAKHLEVKENKPRPSMTQQPGVNKVYTGESVSFGCKVELSSGWGYHWYKDGTEVLKNNSSFNIHNASLSNSGTYKCMATRDRTMYNTDHSNGWILGVLEIPVPILELITPWSDVFPTESVKMSCGMDGTSDWTYTWFKDGVQVQTDNTVSFGSDAATLTISSASASHRGQYTCKGILKSRSVKSDFSVGQTLHVYDTKPTVTLIQNPIHNVMHTEDPVTFSCHINVSSGWEYQWHKDNSLLDVSGNNHTIKSVVITNTGSYQCQAKRGTDTVFLSDQSQGVRLDVEERPQAEIILLTGWSEVFSTDSLVLRCGVQGSQDSWNYTWFKDWTQINHLLSEKHSVTPQNDPNQSPYTCKGIRNGRPSYSRNSDSFQTKNLLLKRRVLLSICGCIFFGIIAVFLGCIVFRVIRKPADGEDRPEEAELFLTMAQLKERDDAPCPLIQYITDAELNVPPKEADENGTICSETTPLPITTQEDQAVTSESNDATENNGGLVSFK